MQKVSSTAGPAAPGRSRWRVSTSNPVKYYSVANRILGFQGVAEPVVNLVREFLSGYYFNPTELSETNFPAHLIAIHQGGDAPSLPQLSGFPIEDGYCYPDGEEIWFAVNGSTILVSAPERKRTDIWLSESTPGRHPLALNNVILYAVQAALRRAGLYQFHAGCVLTNENDQGILLVGDSGSGKSTLTVTLLNQGWRFVSDDNLLLHDSPSGIRAWALRQYFTFDQPTLKTCDLLRYEDSVGGRVPGDRDKLRFYARRAFPHRFVESCFPAVILFTSVGEQIKSELEPIRQAAALTRLIRQCPWAVCDAAAAAAHLGLLTKLAQQAKSYSLAAGRDVFGDPASIASLITEVTHN